MTRTFFSGGKSGTISIANIPQSLICPMLHTNEALHNWNKKKTQTVHSFPTDFKFQVLFRSWTDH